MSLRERVRRLVEDRRFQHTVLVVIVANAITLGAETSHALPGAVADLLHYADRVAIGFFVLELGAKLFAYGWRFFRDPWNCFDFLVVAVAMVPNTGGVSVLRALRVLRVLRLISTVRSMRQVVATLLAAIPGVSSIVGLLVLVIYVAGVMATRLFGEVAPEYFGNLGQSLWTLFQVMTGESWPDVADAVIAERPMAWIFFLVFILVSTFVMLNLFLAVMVNAMEHSREPEPPRAGPEPTPPTPTPAPTPTPTVGPHRAAGPRQGGPRHPGSGRVADRQTTAGQTTAEQTTAEQTTAGQTGAPAPAAAPAAGGPGPWTGVGSVDQTILAELAALRAEVAALHQRLSSTDASPGS